MDNQLHRRVPLYRRVLGAEFDHLPPVVRALHDLSARSVWSGTVDVRRGKSWLARLACRVMGLPPEGTGQPLTVIFTPDDRGREVWLRLFGGFPFRSLLTEHGPHRIAERIGLVTVTYQLTVAEGTLAQTVDRTTCLGLPLPRFLWPRITSLETEHEGAYHFLVDAALPLVGPLVRYEGRLTRET